MGIEIKIEDIPYELQYMVEVIGINKFEEIAKHYGGTSIYIPVHRKIIIGKRNREIIKAYNGKNSNNLGKEFNLSPRQIKKILIQHNIEY